MTPEANAKFTVIDMLPDAQVLTNSGIYMKCPLCEEKAMLAWQFPPLTYVILQCDGCEFLGNPVHLRCRLRDEPYAIVAGGYEAHSRDLRASREGLEEARGLREKIGRMRAHMDQEVAARSGEFIRAMGVHPERVVALARRIGCVPPDRCEGLLGKRCREAVFAVPHYLSDGVVSGIQYVGNHDDDFALLADSGHQPAGMLDLSDGEQPALVMLDVRELCSVLEAYQMVSVDESTAPLIHLESAERPAVFFMQSTRRLVVPTADLTSGYLSTLLHCGNVRFTEHGANQMRTALEYGPRGFVENLWEGGLDFDDLLCASASRGTDRMRSLVSSAEIPPDRLHRIMRSASPEVADGMRAMWKGLPEDPVATVAGQAYYQRAKGGYVCHESGAGDSIKQVEAANVHMRIAERVIAPGRILCRGWLRHEGREVEAELAGPYGKRIRREVLAAYGPAQLRTTPDWSVTGARWMEINYAFSRPPTYDGREECGLHAGLGLLLPGVTIRPRRVEDVSRVTSVGADFLPAGTVDPACNAFSARQDDRMAVLMASSLGVWLAAQARGSPCHTTVLLSGGGATRRATDRLAHLLGFDRDIPGYPQIRNTPSGGENEVVVVGTRSMPSCGESHVYVIPDLSKDVEVGVPPALLRPVWEATRLAMKPEAPPCRCECELFLRCLDEVLEANSISYETEWLRESIVCRAGLSD